MVWETGLEPATSCSQGRRATNCATPRFVTSLQWDSNPHGLVGSQVSCRLDDGGKNGWAGFEPPMFTTQGHGFTDRSLQPLGYPPMGYATGFEPVPGDSQSPMLPLHHAHHKWCRERDSNSHDRSHCVLSAARLPVPPSRHAVPKGFEPSSSAVTGRCLSRLDDRTDRAGGGNRTHNMRLTKPLLCQLSYSGMVLPGGFEPRVSGLKGRHPKPLDDGSVHNPEAGLEPATC